jgi:hypothetical protein
MDIQLGEKFYFYFSIGQCHYFSTGQCLCLAAALRMRKSRSYIHPISPGVILPAMFIPQIN